MILVSECLAGVPCRMDGQAKTVPAVRKLVEEGKAIPVCPEVLGGLPTPRESSEIRNGRVYSKSGVDVTESFIEGAEESLRICREHHCSLAILKSKSPSCGFGKIHDGTFGTGLVDGNGIFAQMLVDEGVRIITEKDLEHGEEY